MIAGTYEEVYGQWRDAPGDRPETKTCTKKTVHFTGGMVNTCYNALDRHVEQGRGNQPALIYDSPVTGTSRPSAIVSCWMRWRALPECWSARGVQKGDRVIIYMPMVPEAVIAMLACARIGAIHSVVFGGFAAHELASRINDAQPKLIISASCGIEVDRVVPYKPLLDKAIEIASVKPEPVHYPPAPSGERRQ